VVLPAQAIEILRGHFEGEQLENKGIALRDSASSYLENQT
jgi:hypothetical protein